MTTDTASLIEELNSLERRCAETPGNPDHYAIPVREVRKIIDGSLSALKENKRLRELLVFIRRGIERDKINDAMILLPYAPDATEADVKPLSALIDDSLQPQVPSEGK